MKAKKLVALAMSVALTVGAASLIAACDKPEGEKPGDVNTPGNYVEDTTVYYAVGSGHGGLEVSNWDEKKDPETLKFVKDTTVTNQNVFKLTLMMYAGDQFKIIHDQSWSGEIGMSYMQGVTEVEDDLVAMMGDTDAKKNVVKDTAGTIVFYESGGFGNNIALAVGQDATYTFYLHTFPESDTQSYITFEKGATHDRWKEPYKMALVGDINGFNTITPYTMSNSDGVWSAKIDITEDDLAYNATGEEAETGATHSAIYVMNAGDGTGVENEKMAFVDETLNPVEVTAYGKTYTVNLLTEGTWIINFNQETQTVTIKEMSNDIHFIGGMNSWSVDATDTVYKLSSEDGVNFTGTITLTEKTELKLFNVNGVGDDRYLPGSLSGNYNLDPGKYVFTYNADTDECKYDKYEYYIVGTFVDAENNPQNFVIVKDLTPVLVETETPNVYKATLEVKDITSIGSYGDWVPGSDGGGSIFAIQVVYGTALNGVETWNISGENQYFKAEGTYEITIDVTTPGTSATWTLVTE